MGTTKSVKFVLKSVGVSSFETVNVVSLQKLFISKLKLDTI